MFKVSGILKATGGRLTNGPRNVIADGISIDSRTIKNNNVFVAIRGNSFDGHDFIGQAIRKGAKAVIADVSSVKCHVPGDVAFINVKDTTKALGDIAKFQREKFDIPLIAVTGSNGKTTTKEMISDVLCKRFKVLKNEGTKNNNIGLPLTLLKLDSSYTCAVLELGTNHPGEIAYLAKICQPTVVVITNIGPSHLEFFKDLTCVFKEKYSLVKYLQIPRILVTNADDNLLRKAGGKNIAKPFILGFGIKKSCDFTASDVKSRQGGVEFMLNRANKFYLNTLGRNNVYNALAAIAVARLLGLEYQEISGRLSEFSLPKGRLQIRALENVRFIDDTYNSNPLSLNAALDTLVDFKTKGRKIVVMGDMLELGSNQEKFHKEAGRKAAKACDVLISVGKFSKTSARAARSCGFDIQNMFTCNSSQEARDILFNKVFPKREDIILVKGSRAMRMEEVFRI